MKIFILIITTSLLQPSGSVAFSQVDQKLLKQFTSAVSEIPRLRKKASLHVRTSSVIRRTDTLQKFILEKDYSPAALKKIRDRGLDPEKELQESVMKSEYALREGDMLEIGDRPNGIHFVLAKNKDYMFQLSKSPSLDAYSVQSVNESRERLAPPLEKAMQRREKTLNGLVLAAWGIFGQPLEELVASDGFEVTAIAEMTMDERTVVRIDFGRIEEEFRPLGMLTDAYIICDPGKQWAVLEYAATVHNHKKEPMARKKNFQDLSEFEAGTPFIKKIAGTTTWLDKSDKIETGETTMELVSANPEKDLFRMSGYGLPEPQFEFRWLTSSSWLMYLIVGIGCLMGVTYWRRRQTSTNE